MANTAGLKRGGSPGRPKGVPNKATKEVKELARRLVLEPEYQQKLRHRLLKGTLPPAVESLLWHYAFGKPKDTLDLNVEERRYFMSCEAENASRIRSSVSSSVCS